MTVDHADGARTGLLSTLRNGGMRKLYAAEIVSGAGDGVFWVALVVFLSERDDFALWLTVAVFARLAPRAFLSLPAGALVDRSNLRRLVVGSELLRSLLMLVLALLVAADAPVPLVLTLVFVSYAVAAPTRPALSAIVPTVAGERHLAGANAALSTIRQIMTFVGPLVGVAVVTNSAAAGFAVNAATFAISALIIATVHGIPNRSQAVRPSRRTYTRLGPVSAFVDGITAVRSIAALTPLVALIGVMYFVRGAEMVLFVFLVRDELGVGVELVGVLSGAVGLGALIAMPIASRAADSVSPVRPIVFSLLATAIPTALLAVVTSTAWAAAVLVVVGVGMVVFEVVIVVVVQRITPPASLGRVFGAINGASNTGKLVGALVAPAAATGIGVDASLVAVAVAVVVVGAAATWPLVRIGRVSSARRRELAPTVRELSRLSIFEGATGPSLERIAAGLAQSEVPSGGVVLRQGDPADDLYIARSGHLVASRDRVEVGGIGPGDFFGEIGLLEERPRTATVTATTDVRLWRIPGDVFLDALDDAGAAPSALVEAMADRLSSHRAPRS